MRQKPQQKLFAMPIVRVLLDAYLRWVKTYDTQEVYIGEGDYDHAIYADRGIMIVKTDDTTIKLEDIEFDDCNKVVNKLLESMKADLDYWVSIGNND